MVTELLSETHATAMTAIDADDAIRYFVRRSYKA